MRLGGYQLGALLSLARELMCSTCPQGRRACRRFSWAIRATCRHSGQASRRGELQLFDRKVLTSPTPSTASFLTPSCPTLATPTLNAQLDFLPSDTYGLYNPAMSVDDGSQCWNRLRPERANGGESSRRCRAALTGRWLTSMGGGAPLCQLAAKWPGQRRHRERDLSDHQRRAEYRHRGGL